MDDRGVGHFSFLALFGLDWIYLSWETHTTHLQAHHDHTQYLQFFCFGLEKSSQYSSVPYIQSGIINLMQPDFRHTLP